MPVRERSLYWLCSAFNGDDNDDKALLENYAR